MYPRGKGHVAVVVLPHPHECVTFSQLGCIQGKEIWNRGIETMKKVKLILEEMGAKRERPLKSARMTPPGKYSYLIIKA
jgi:hypothetical protein